MDERHSMPEAGCEQEAYEVRLRSYYGPVLPDQPLPDTSWQHVRAQLQPRRSIHRWRSELVRHIGVRAQPQLPWSFQTAFISIAEEARFEHPLSMLGYRTGSRIHTPRIRVSLLARHPLQLLLPVHSVHSLVDAELNVLLASGCARYQAIRRPGYVLVRLLLCVAFLIALSGVLWTVYTWHDRLWLVVPLALLLLVVPGMVVFWLLNRQSRRMILRADERMVQWIGREQSCRGLRALAARSRTPARKRWGEPSLHERIDQVCGSVAMTNEERILAR
jgi:hypothetical protein